MSETQILDEVKYDLFRRILAGVIAAPRGVDNPVAAAQILTGQAYEALTDSGVIRKNPPPPAPQFIGFDDLHPKKPQQDKCWGCGITRAMKPSTDWYYSGGWLLCPTCVLFSVKISESGETIRFGQFVPRPYSPRCMACGQLLDNAPKPSEMIVDWKPTSRCHRCFQVLPEPKEALQTK